MNGRWSLKRKDCTWLINWIRIGLIRKSWKNFIWRVNQQYLQSYGTWLTLKIRRNQFWKQVLWRKYWWIRTNQHAISNLKFKAWIVKEGYRTFTRKFDIERAKWSTWWIHLNVRRKIKTKPKWKTSSELVMS